MDVLTQTIENMRSSGVSDDEIKNMLASMGYDENIINNALKGSQTEPKPEEQKKEEPKQSIAEVQKPDQTKVTQEVKQEADKAVLASNLAMNVSEAVVNKVQKHAEQVSAVKQDVDKLNDTISNLPTKEHIEQLQTKTNELHINTQDLNNKVDDILARVKVLENIMNKILDSQRDILMKMK